MATNNCNNNCTNSFGVCAKNNWCRTPIPAEYDTKLTVVEQIAKLNSVVNQILCMLDCNGDCGSGCSPCGPSDIKPLVVFVESFGAVGDGVYNDTDAFQQAAQYAADNNLILTTAGRTYLLDPDKIDLDCNFDGNNCTIIPSGAGNRIFQYPGSNVSYTLTQAAFSTDRANINTLWGKTFLVQTPKVVANRSGTTPYYHRQMMACDPNGKFINAWISTEALIAGNYTVTNVRDLNETPLFFRNVRIEYSNCFPSLLNCARNNVHVSGITINGTYTSQVWTDACLEYHECFGCTIENCVGGNPVGPGSGYALGVYDVSDFTANNVSFYQGKSDSWPALGISSIVNGTFNDCDFTRFDWHYQMFGILRVTGGTYGAVYLGGGYGKFIMENCSILNYTGAQSLIQWRGDFPDMLSGTYNFRQMHFDNQTANATILESPSWTPEVNRSLIVNFDDIYYFNTSASYWCAIDYAYTAYINFTNCTIGSVNTVRAESNCYVSLNQCIINNGGDTFRPVYTSEAKVGICRTRLVNCQLYQTLNIGNSSRYVIVTGCDLMGLFAGEGSKAVIAGCTISKDVAPQISGSSNVVMYANEINYGTAPTNQSKWNVAVA